MIRIYLLKAHVLHLVWAVLSSIAEKAGDHGDAQIDTAIDLAHDTVQKRVDALEAEAAYAQGVAGYWTGVCFNKKSDAQLLKARFDQEVNKLLG